jgi:hypothetical protein
MAPGHAASRNEGRVRSSANCPYGLMCPWNSGVNARRSSVVSLSHSPSRSIVRSTEERVDQHEAVLEDLQRQGDDFLLFSAIRGQFALTTIADEVIGRVPVLDDVESLMDLPLNLSRSKIKSDAQKFPPSSDNLRRSLCQENTGART